MRVRPPAVAGLFYPADPDELRATVTTALDEAGTRVTSGAPPPKALIVPHAGYPYSAPVAATAYRRFRVAGSGPAVRRVVLLGPAHRAHFAGVAAAPSADAFSTPLGEMMVDREARDAALDLPGVVVDDRAHAQEHSIEVHLPFLQVVLGDVPIVPFVVGRPGPDVLADLIDRCWDGTGTVVVVSSDLSHYHDYDTAVALDRETAQAIVGRRTADVTPDRACGAYPIQGLLETAARHGLDIENVDLRNSGDTAGGRDRVVGYGSFVLA